MSIVEFLEARIAEDEAVAREADGARWFHSDKIVTFEVLGEDGNWGDATSPINVDTRANGWHITRWSPDRVLAECEAKRRVLEIHYPYNHKGEHGSAVFCAECQWEHGDNSPRIDNQSVEGFGTHPCGTLAALASIYADHPDYDPAWRIA